MSPQPNRPLNIIIVGGSLTGLFAGIALASLPEVANVTILERLRDSQLQDLGAGIRCNEEVSDGVFELMGVKPNNYAAFVDVYRQLDSTGNVLSKVETGTWTTTWGQLYRLLRHGFEDVKGRYRLGCTVTGVQQEKEGINGTDAQSIMRVDFENEQGQTESITADLVIGADGASSKVRSLVLPHVERTKAPYLLYRGVVQPSDLSPETMKLYEKAALFSWPGHGTGQFVSYVVPGDNETPDPSTHCVNWVLYSNKSPEETKELMTDNEGILHHYQLARGKMRDEEFHKLRQEAVETLPPVHVEVIEKTKQPFVQLVTDSLSPQNSFMDGKLLLIGDAVGGQRPHSASALLQGIYHSLLLRPLLQNTITLASWSEQTRNLTKILVDAGQEMGQILMGDVQGPQEKIPRYMASFMKAQEELNGIWRGTIGIGDARVKM